MYLSEINISVVSNVDLSAINPFVMLLEYRIFFGRQLFDGPRVERRRLFKIGPPAGGRAEGIFAIRNQCIGRAVSYGYGIRREKPEAVKGSSLFAPLLVLSGSRCRFLTGFIDFSSRYIPQGVSRLALGGKTLGKVGEGNTDLVPFSLTERWDEE